MSASFVVYIDESGDEGFVFNPDGSGSSRWFVLGAVVLRKSTELATVKLNDAVRTVLKYDAKRKPLHFVDLRHEHRVVWIDHVARAPIRVLVVAVHKPSLREPERFQQKSMLYHLATRFLLERVSWCCRDHRREGEGDGSTEVVFSHRANISYPDMRASLTLLKKKAEVGDVSIDWGVIDPEKMTAASHASRMGLRIADACASSFFCGVQCNPQGFTEPRYATMLKPVVYSHKGRKIGNGFKLWPGEADAIVATEKHLHWITEAYR